MPSNRAAVLAALPLAAATIAAQREAAAILGAVAQVSEWTPLPHQVPPEGEWSTWLLLAGRGAGKTDACAAYIDAHVKGPPCIPGIHGGHRPAIIAPTLGDALEACVNGPSGLKAHNPSVTSVQTTGGTYVRWPNGAEAKLFGAYSPDDVERLRAGGNRCIAWAEELAAWRHLDDAWDHLQFGLRLGPHPRVVTSTTPKNRKLLRNLISDASTAITRASTYDNPHLADVVLQRFEQRYAGTRLGRQELNAELLEDVDGALWTYDMFDPCRDMPDMQRVVVAIDPAATSKRTSDDTGIIVGGLGVDGRGYIIADRTCHLGPDGWARRAVYAFDEFHADRIVAEVNNGGEMVEHTVRTVRRGIPYKAVHASRGKAIRAEPVAALYEQAKISHAEGLADLEAELTTWTPDSGWSPGRLDATVWVLTELMVQTAPRLRAF